MAAEQRDDDLLGVKEIAKRIGVTTRTLRRWISKDYLPPPSFHIGTVKRWYRVDIEAWIRGRAWYDKQGQTAIPADNRGQSRTKADKHPGGG